MIFNKVDLPLPDLPLIENKPLSGNIKEILFKTTLSLLFSNLYFFLIEDSLKIYKLKMPPIY